MIQILIRMRRKTIQIKNYNQHARMVLEEVWNPYVFIYLDISFSKVFVDLYIIDHCFGSALY